MHSFGSDLRQVVKPYLRPRILQPLCCRPAIVRVDLECQEIKPHFMTGDTTCPAPGMGVKNPITGPGVVLQNPPIQADRLLCRVNRVPVLLERGPVYDDNPRRTIERRIGKFTMPPTDRKASIFSRTSLSTTRPGVFCPLICIRRSRLSAVCTVTRTVTFRVFCRCFFMS